MINSATPTLTNKHTFRMAWVPLGPQGPSPWDMAQAPSPAPASK